MNKNKVLIAAIALSATIAATLAILNFNVVHGSEELTSLKNLRQLIVNDTFTALYNTTTVYTSTGNGNWRYETKQYSLDYISVGFVNGGRAFVRLIKVIGLTNPSPTTPITQEIAHWINATGELCIVNYIVMYNGRTIDTLNCLSGIKPSGVALLSIYLPFSEVLGNYTLASSYISSDFSQYFVNYSRIVHVRFLNESRWRGETIYCFNLTATATTTMHGPPRPATTLQNSTELICLLPNGVPVMQMLRYTFMLMVGESRTVLMASINKQLINYTLNYFNATLFSEVLRKHGSTH